MEKKSTVFAVMLGNRDLFPSHMLKDARRELQKVIQEAGYGVLMPPEDLTFNGAVKNIEEGRKFAAFLEEHRGSYDGVILSLPNFGDENAAAAALRDAEVPILIQGYPDEMHLMGPETRRDSYCGKLSVMNVFRQYGIPYTDLSPHVISPSDPRFKENLRIFDGICRTANSMKRCTLGAIGARTTAFKTVRFDEIAMQKYGITVESLDLSEIFARVRSLNPASEVYREKKHVLTGYADCSGASELALDNLVRLGVVLDEVIDEYSMDMVALRCWIEMEKQLNITPCVLLGMLNNRGVTAACEMDGSTAAAMYALQRAAGRPSACLDWNNNYGDDEEKCILFHCGPVAADMLSATGPLVNHAMFERVLGHGVSCGCHPGRITPGAMTFAGAKTEDGMLQFYIGEGEFTSDTVPEDFFGCAGVASITGLQDKLHVVGTQGYHHHVGVVHTKVAKALEEAFKTYLGYPITNWNR